MQNDDSYHILATAATGTMALQALYEAKKKRMPKFSLAVLARQAGILSRSYLSEVMRGQKRLHPRYLPGICQALQLDGLAAEVLRLLVQIDRSPKKTRGKGAVTAWQEELIVARKALQLRTRPLTASLMEDLFALRVFASFGLFQGKPSLAKLRQVFGSRADKNIRQALEKLHQAGLVQGQKNAYVITDNQVVMDRSLPVLKLFFKKCLRDAEMALHKWLPERKLAYFESSIISVDQEAYEAALQEFRAICHRFQSKVETERANRLVQFNVQIYPFP